MNFELSTSEKLWQEQAREFALDFVAPLARQMDARSQMHPDIIPEMARRGFLGATIAKEFGGSAMSHLALALVYEELGRACSNVRGFMTVHSSLVMQCIDRHGSAEQRSYYLPKLASAELIGCYGLTEPDAGSDAASIRTTARKTDGGYILNGEKIWITNGLSAGIAIIFAKLEDAPSDKPHRAVTAFLVDTSARGFHREKMSGIELGHRASEHAHFTLTDCFVPSSSVLGEEYGGFAIAMNALTDGRLGVAAGAVGIHQASLDASVDFVRSRRQFGMRIGDMQMTQSLIADMKASLEASRLVVYRTASMKDAGDDTSSWSSIAKLTAVESALKAAGDAVLLHGARGYSNEYPVERYFRDIKGMQIYEGSSQIQRIVIARSVIGKP